MLVLDEELREGELLVALLRVSVHPKMLPPERLKNV